MANRPVRKRWSKTKIFFIVSTTGSTIAVMATSLYFIHRQIGISPEEIQAYMKALPFMFFYWLLLHVPIPFLSEGMGLVQLLGLDNVPIRDRQAFEIAMTTVQTVLCLLPFITLAGAILFVRWVRRPRKQP